MHGKGGIHAGETATEAGSRHPTGMHSGLQKFLTPFFHFSAFYNLDSAHGKYSETLSFKDHIPRLCTRVSVNVTNWFFSV